MVSAIDWHDGTAEVGGELARRLTHLERDDVTVVAIEPTSVPVAFELAVRLGGSLDVTAVRTLRQPGRPEVVLGAVGEWGARVVDPGRVARAGLTDAEVVELERRARSAVVGDARRRRGGRRPPPLVGRTVVLVDDGTADELALRAACRAACAGGARRVVVASAVATPTWLTAAAEEADAWVHASAR